LLLGGDFVDERRKPGVAVIEFAPGNFLAEGDGGFEVGEAAVVAEVVKPDVGLGRKSVAKDLPGWFEQTLDGIVQSASGRFCSITTILRA
jgi:hypothetical protein